MWQIVSGFFSWVLSPVLNVLNFPVIPVELVDIITAGLEYVQSGLSIFNWFCPIAVITPAITMFMSVWLVKHGYDMVMWILRKIPFIGVE